MHFLNFVSFFAGNDVNIAKKPTVFKLIIALKNELQQAEDDAMSISIGQPLKRPGKSKFMKNAKTRATLMKNLHTRQIDLKTFLHAIGANCMFTGNKMNTADKDPVIQVELELQEAQETQEAFDVQGVQGSQNGPVEPQDIPDESQDIPDLDSELEVIESSQFSPPPPPRKSIAGDDLRQIRRKIDLHACLSNGVATQSKFAAISGSRNVPSGEKMVLADAVVLAQQRLEQINFILSPTQMETPADGKIHKSMIQYLNT